MNWQQLFNYISDPARTEREIRDAYLGLRILGFATERTEMVDALKREIREKIQNYGGDSYADWSPRNDLPPALPSMPANPYPEVRNDRRPVTKNYWPWIIGIGIGVVVGLAVAAALLFGMAWMRGSQAAATEMPAATEVVMATEEVVATEAVSETLQVVIETVIVTVEVTPEPAATEAPVATEAPLPTEPVLEPTRPFYQQPAYPEGYVNPNLNRPTEEPNWESTYIWTVSDNGQKLGIFEGVGPYGLNCSQILEGLLLDPTERELIVRCSPEGPLSGGWWTIETRKTKSCESPNGLVPCAGTNVHFNLDHGGRFDYWGGFNPPQPASACVDQYAGLDQDSELRNWQVVCTPDNGGEAITDGVSFYSAWSNFYPAR